MVNRILLLFRSGGTVLPYVRHLGSDLEMPCKQRLKYLSTWRKHRLHFIQKVSWERKAQWTNHFAYSYRSCGFVITLQNDHNILLDLSLLPVNWKQCFWQRMLRDLVYFIRFLKFIGILQITGTSTLQILGCFNCLYVWGCLYFGDCGVHFP